MDEMRDQILDAFETLFPDAYCELNHRNHFELLVAVMLSAQTTDVSVNKVTPRLFERFPTPKALKEASIEEIEAVIKHLGLFKTKARNLKKMADLLIEHHQGIVPNTRSELMALPGVGRKTANVVLSVAFDIPAFAVDTHVERVSKRLGLAKESDQVLTVEKKITEFFPSDRWNKLHHQMIFFGRYHCLAKKPHCDQCPLFNQCQFKEKYSYAKQS
jgi:endonuclease III